MRSAYPEIYATLQLPTLIANAATIVSAAHQEISAMSFAPTIPAARRFPSALQPSPSLRRAAVGRPTTPEVRAISNPLWVIVIGMACFFGVAALILAWS
jgi:hypothetical protein